MLFRMAIFSLIWLIWICTSYYNTSLVCIIVSSENLLQFYMFLLRFCQITTGIKWTKMKKFTGVDICFKKFKILANLIQSHASWKWSNKEEETWKKTQTNSVWKAKGTTCEQKNHCSGLLLWPSVSLEMVCRVVCICAQEIPIFLKDSLSFK